MSEFAAVSGRVARTSGAPEPALAPSIVAAYRAAGFPAGFDDPQVVLTRAALAHDTPTLSHLMVQAHIAPFRPLGVAVSKAIVAVNRVDDPSFRLESIHGEFVGFDFARIAAADPATRAEVLAALQRFSEQLSGTSAAPRTVAHTVDRTAERTTRVEPRRAPTAVSRAPATAATQATPAPQRTAPRAPIRETSATRPGSTARRGGILFVGDSHTEALAARFKDVPHGGGTVRENFKRGTRADQWVSGALAERYRESLASGPDVVVISLGTNDGLARKPARELAANVRTLVEQARAANAKVIFALPLRTTQHREAVDAARTAIADALRGQPGVDVIDVSRANVPLRDGIHATLTGGYRAWAQFIMDHANASSRDGFERAAARNRK